MKERVLVEDSVHEDTRRYHVRRLMVQNGVVGWGLESHKTTTAEHRELAVSFLNSLLSHGDIGVQSVLIAGYQIWITKGKAFSWEEVQPYVFRAIYNAVYDEEWEQSLGD